MFRYAGLDDSRAIAEVHVASWQETYVGQVPDDFLANLSVSDREAGWRQSFTHEGHRLLLAEENDIAVGFVSFGPSRGSDTNRDSVGEIYAIYLRREFKGQGIGRELWDRATEELISRGYATAIVWVLETNSAAKGFYEKRGCFPDGAIKQIAIGGMTANEIRFRLNLKG